ncbi:Flp pilus assembly complex ATPase component TadA [Patescibacteria group bacterium]|nr:Flp pilus assembly complex ATPase component TadA [Patescibacteria group bacterium]
MNSSVNSLILAVDDDQDTLRLIERILANSDYRVITADSGNKALLLLEKANPDLTLLDVVMPEMDGYEVCSRLQSREETAYIPVIFVSVLGEEQDRTRAFSVGAVDYVVKPIQKNILLHKIKAHLKTKDLWRRFKDGVSWSRRVSSSDFTQFSEFLFDQLSLSGEKKKLLSGILPSKVYSISSELGIRTNKMAQYMATFMKLPYVSHINPQDVQLGVMPTRFCKSNHVVAVRDETGKRAFVLSNPFNWDLLDLLEKFSGLESTSKVKITEPENITSLCAYSVTAPAKSVTAPIKKVFVVEKKEKIVKPAKETIVKISESEIEKRPVMYIANNILNTAVSERASDIHIEPKETNMIVRFRIDGDMRKMFTLKQKTGIMVISRLKVFAGMDIAERRRPQDGSFATTINNRKFNLRLATTSTLNGESLIMRLLEPNATPKDLGELGMTEEQTNTMINFVNRNQGLVLMVGPMGSGKTTTIYSLLYQADCKTRSLISVEDPVEYRIPFANQQQVNEKSGITFETLLKSSVRQDPDILFVGEIRDQYSAKICMDFASTGHLTVATLHTSNATTAIFRLERVGINRGTMTDVILGIVAQRLLKKLCPYCKEILPISKEEIEMLLPFTYEVPSRVAHPVGCDKCHHTGYYGREGIYEIIKFDQEISEIVRSGIPISEIRVFAHKRGDYLISDQAVEKVKNHIFPPRDAYEKILVEEVAPKKLELKKTVTTVLPGREKGRQDSILVVEDDEDTRVLIARLLENSGYKVTLAEDGIDALLQMGKTNFNLILADINMPNLDGFKLLEMKIQKGIKEPVVFLTSRNSPEDEERAFELGAADYIKKPILKKILLSKIRNLLQNKK